MGVGNSIGKVIGSEGFAKVATGTAGTVYAMTTIKAVGRPLFIYKDKNADEKTKKYAATAEFLYQVICLLLTLAVVPFFKTGGLKLAEKYLKKCPEAKEILDSVSNKSLYSRGKAFDSKFSEIKKTFNSETTDNQFKNSMTMAHGGIEAGSFIGSVLGLTVIAPPVSHKIIKPIMHLIGMDKNESTSKSDNKSNVNVKA